MTRPGRLAGAAAALALTIGGLVTAAPATASACSGSRGVTVVVDNGGSISTRCAAGDPSSAKAALQAAGFSTTDVQTQPGFLCRVDGVPAADPCVRTPPSTAYWAFFHARRGGSWSYSTLGYAAFDPAPGTVVGFRFGAGSPPRVAPPAPTVIATPVPTPTPKPTPKPSPTPVRTRPTTAPQSVTPEATGSVPPPSATRSAASASSASSSASAPTSSVPTSTGPTSSAPVVASGPVPAGGSSTGPVLMGAGLVVLVGAAGAYAAWRRRLS